MPAPRMGLLLPLEPEPEPELPPPSHAAPAIAYRREREAAAAAEEGYPPPSAAQPAWLTAAGPAAEPARQEVRRLRAIEEAKHNALRTELARFERGAAPRNPVADAADARRDAERRAGAGAREREIVALKAECARLRQAGDDERARTTSQLGQLRSDSLRSQQAANGAVAEVSRLSAELMAKDRDARQLLEEHAEARRLLVSVRAELEEERARSSAAETIANTARHHIAEVSAAAEDSEHARAASTADLAAARSLTQELQLELAQAQAQAAAAVAGSEAAEAEAGRRGAALSVAQEENARIVARLGRMELQLEEISGLGATLDEKLAQFGLLEAELAREKRALLEARAHAASLRHSEARAAAECAGATERLASLDEELTRTREENQSLVAQVETLSGPLAVTVSYANAGNSPVGRGGISPANSQPGGSREHRSFLLEAGSGGGGGGGGGSSSSSPMEHDALPPPRTPAAGLAALPPLPPGSTVIDNRGGRTSPPPRVPQQQQQQRWQQLDAGLSSPPSSGVPSAAAAGGVSQYSQYSQYSPAVDAYGGTTSAIGIGNSFSGGSPALLGGGRSIVPQHEPHRDRLGGYHHHVVGAAGVAAAAAAPQQPLLTAWSSLDPTAAEARPEPTTTVDQLSGSSGDVGGSSTTTSGGGGGGDGVSSTSGGGGGGGGGGTASYAGMLRGQPVALRVERHGLVIVPLGVRGGGGGGGSDSEDQSNHPSALSNAHHANDQQSAAAAAGALTIGFDVLHEWAPNQVSPQHRSSASASASV